MAVPTDEFFTVLGPEAGPSHAVQLATCFVLFAAIFAFWLSPGGLVWALSKARRVKESAYELLFHRAIGFAPYGEYWRNLRRISATDLFSPRRIAVPWKSPAQIALQMVGKIRALVEERGEVGLRMMLQFGSLNNLMTTVFRRSYDFGAGNGGGGLELERLVSEGYELLGAFDWGEQFPLLRSLDLQGVRRSCRRLRQKVNAFAGAIVEDLRLAPFGAGRSYDFGGGGLELERLLSEGYELLDTFNWGDYFPLLRSLDLQGVRRRCRELCQKLSMEMRVTPVCEAIQRRVQV